MVKTALGVDSAYINRYIVPYFLTFPDGYKHFECKAVGGPAQAHRILSAQIARTEEKPEEPTTDIALAKNEYAVPSDKVPGYLLVTPSFTWRFQLATPKLDDVIRYAKHNGFPVDNHAPGDHKRVTINGVKLQLNKSKRGNHVDLASAKAFARQIGVQLHNLNKTISYG